MGPLLIAVLGSFAGGCQLRLVPPPKLPDLRAELLDMVKVDQEVRKRLMAEIEKPSPEAVRAVQDIDGKNTARMRAVVAAHGWPGRTLVGRDGAHAAWLLVQHADRDRPWQNECLDRMGKLPAGEVAPGDLAYLTDRVLVGEGKP